MKKLVLFSLAVLVLVACGQQPKKQKKNVAETPVQKALVLSVDDLLKKAPELADKEVMVKGTVLHVCKHGGKRCFLMGSTEELIIRVEAGEKIGAFTQEQVGSELEITGMLKEIKTKADEHRPGAEEEEHHHDTKETEEAHKIIDKSNKKAGKRFFIKGSSVKTL